jgi:5-oxoprolinase (ATP-hydrolysing) subunit A
MQIDLNGDVGESFGAYEIGDDAALIPILTSANIACGFHAGDPGVMRATVALAREHGTAIGAHPGFPDLVGFGRREIRATPLEVEDFVAYQIGALAAITAAQGARLAHVKPHGALYNMAARDAELADAIARAVAAVDPSLKLFGLPGSKSLEAARRHQVRAVSEAFADRAYRRDGSLVPRSEPWAVIDDEEVVVTRAVAIARDRVVFAADGTRVPLDVETICVHGDTPGAAVLASRIRQALGDAGIQVRAPV